MKDFVRLKGFRFLILQHLQLEVHRHRAQRCVHVSQASRRLLLQQQRRLRARFLQALYKIKIGFDLCVARIAHESSLQELKSSLQVVVAGGNFHNRFVASNLNFDIVALAEVRRRLAV